MTYAVGQRYILRSGAVARVSYVHPFDPWRFLVLVIERRVDGTECDPDRPCKISLCPDGKYYPRDEEHELDLVKEIAYRGRAAA